MVAITVRLPRASAAPRILGGLALLAAVGWAVPALLLGDGTGRWADGSAERVAAENALRNAWIHADNPLQRLVFLKARVDEVRLVPYHCGRPAEGVPAPVRELAASVTYHSWFGVPVAGVVSDCGGEGDFWARGVRGMPGPRIAAHPIVGSWEIASWACPGVCALSAAEARAMLGRRVEYARDRAGWHDVSCGPVSYATEATRASAVEAEYGLPVGALELPDGLQVVRIECDGEAWPWPGGTVLLTGSDRGYVVHEGVFFGLVRADAVPAEAAVPPPEGCDRIEVRAPTLIALLWLPAEEDGVTAPPAGLDATVSAFRTSLDAARPQLDAQGVAVREYAGSCLEIVTPESLETMRLRSLTGGAGYLLRGLGIREMLSGVQDPTALVQFATRAVG